MPEVILEEARTLPASAYVPLGRTGRTVSRVGFGTYRVDDRHPAQREALELALDSGINLIDTSTNYGDGHSELLIGQVLKARAAAGKDNTGITLVTKAGYVQGSNQREAHRRFKAGSPWPEMTEYSKDCWHCISPAFLKDQITFSLDRLARPRVDVFLLHNPEYFLSDQHNKRVNSEEAQDEFHARLTRAFAHLETEVAAGRIGSYGISSNTFVVPRDRHDFVDLTRVLENAGPGFSVIQLPLNPVELGAREKHHTRDKRSVLDVAKAAGLGVLVNRPLNGFSQQSLVRFAAIAPPFPVVPGASSRSLAQLAALEADFARTFAPRLSMEKGAPPPEELLDVHDFFKQVAASAKDMVTIAESWEQFIAPRLSELLPQLEEAFAKDPAFATWSRDYRRLVNEVASWASQRALENEGTRNQGLADKVRAAFGDVPGETISQKTLHGLATTPGVDCVLLGMRKTRYVEDALGAFVPPA